MQDTIGLKSKGDRPLIPFLRSLGFIDTSGKPTPEYSLLKGSDRRTAVADGIRKAYKPLFDSDEKAWEYTGERLRGLISQVAGTDEDMTARIANTFVAAAKIGDFSGSLQKKDQTKKDGNTTEDELDEHAAGRKQKGLRTEFHYNIQVVLPSNATEDVYLNIFNAIRRTFQ
jgi:hypothetical protein